MSDSGSTGSASAGSTSTSSTGSAPSAPTSSPSAGVSAGGQNSNPNASPVAGQNQPAHSSGGVAPNPNALDSAADDFEEVALGSTKTKVPKTLAQQIKNYERGIQQKFEQAARERKQFQQAQELNNLFKTDPDAWAQRMGVDLDSMAEERLAKKYELMQASPEQKQLMEANKRLAEYEKMVLSQKQPLMDAIKDLVPEASDEELKQYNPQQLQQILQHQQVKRQQVQQGLDKEFGDAWAQSGLPKSSYFGQQMAYEMIRHQKKTGEPLQAGEAAAKVKAGFFKNIQEIVSQMDPKGIQELLGKEILERLRQADIERVTSQGASTFGNKGPGNSPASQAPKKAMNEIEWRQWAGLD